MAPSRKIAVLTLAVCLVAFVFSVSACQQKAEKPATEQVQKPQNVYEGTVKFAVGKYMYIPTAQGFDVILEGFDASSLLGKDIRVHGEVLPDKPWVFRADSAEVKEASGAYSQVFTRTAELDLSQAIDLQAREVYPALTITTYKKADEWAGKDKGKVFGELQDSTIIILDSKGKEVGRVIVDSMTDFARYYLAKLRLFDNFWFYLDIKDTVDARTRNKTKELFHADLVLVGLF